MAIKKNFCSPKAIAETLHISVATVNYYTNIGLFRAVDRQGNKRLYDMERILLTFAKIKELRKQGYSLGLIRDRLQL